MPKAADHFLYESQKPRCRTCPSRPIWSVRGHFLKIKKPDNGWRGRVHCTNESQRTLQRLRDRRLPQLRPRGLECQDMKDSTVELTSRSGEPVRVNPDGMDAATALKRSKIIGRRQSREDPTTPVGPRRNEPGVPDMWTARACFLVSLALAGPRRRKRRASWGRMGIGAP